MLGTIRLVLADDHLQVRALLRSLLEGQEGIEVVGEAGDGAEALAVAARQKADVILMDLSMPGVGGLQALQQLQDQHWRPAVIIVTMHDAPEYVREAMARGARGYLLKTCPAPELIGAIRAVAGGKTHITNTLAARMAAWTGLPKTSRAEPATLSSSEIELLRLIALGHTSQDIARRLATSAEAVRACKERVMAKLAVRSRAELVHYAISNNLIGSEMA